MGYDFTVLRDRLAQQMGELLSRPPLGPMDDFFLCGGDSLLAVKLISQLVDSLQPGQQEAERLRGALLMAVFDDATPDALAKVMLRRPS